MSLGMEMLVKTAIKAMNIDPDLLMSQLRQWLQWGESKIMDFDARIRDMEANQKILIEQNAQFIAYIQAMSPALKMPTDQMGQAHETKEIHHD